MTDTDGAHLADSTPPRLYPYPPRREVRPEGSGKKAVKKLSVVVNGR